MKKLSFLIVIFLFFSLITLNTFAKSKVFKVIALKGFPSLSSGKIIKVGDALFDNEIINVEKPCYLALIHKSGKTLEIKDAGKYNLEEISKNLYSNKLKVNKELASYLYESIYDIELKLIKAIKNIQIDCIYDPYRKIFLCLPKFSNILNSQDTIIWNKVQNINTYKINITDIRDSILFTKETNDTFLIFNSNSFRTYRIIILDIKNSKDESIYSQRHVIKITFENKAIEILNNFRDLNKEYSDETALDCLVKASFYSKNNYFLNAQYYYERAKKLEPDILEYKNAYVNFMNRNVLSDFIRE